jgi:hypothetical protein
VGIGNNFTIGKGKKFLRHAFLIYWAIKNEQSKQTISSTNLLTPG